MGEKYIEIFEYIYIFKYKFTNVRYKYECFVNTFVTGWLCINEMV